MNILVTGANGQLGTELRNLAANGKDRWIFSDVSQVPGLETLSLDVSDLDTLRLLSESESVDLFINCASYSDVDKAESDQSLADSINHLAAASLAKVSFERGAFLIHISSDYVFHGDSSVPYKEDDETDPLGVYGVTKLAGERAIENSGCSYLILRTAWLFSPYGHNFVKTILELSAERPNLRVVFDQIGSPTYAADLAKFICDVVDRRQFIDGRIYHITDEGAISWYDFAKAISEIAGGYDVLAGKARRHCDILPCHSEDYPSAARRPHYSVLDKSLVKRDFGVTLPYWRDSLLKCIDRIFGMREKT